MPNMDLERRSKSKNGSQRFSYSQLDIDVYKWKIKSSIDPMCVQKKVPWWKKIALYLLTHGEQNHLELQSWREEKVGIKSWIWKTLLMIWIIYLCNHNLAKVIEEVMDRMVEFHNLMPKCAEIKSQILQSWFRSVRELLIHLTPSCRWVDISTWTPTPQSCLYLGPSPSVLDNSFFAHQAVSWGSRHYQTAGCGNRPLV